MNKIKIASALSILIFLALIEGCLQPSSGSDIIFAMHNQPEDGFSMKYPQTWEINRTPYTNDPNYSRVMFSGPGNQTSFGMIIHHHYFPEGKDEGGIGLGYDVPNSTTIEFQKEIQISGANGFRWTFLVNDNDREYIDNVIVIIQKCPELENNRIDYFINYKYTSNNTQQKYAVEEMLNSIKFTCPSMN